MAPFKILPTGGEFGGGRHFLQGGSKSTFNCDAVEFAS